MPLLLQVPLKLAAAFANVAQLDPDNSTVFNLSSHALCVFLQKATVMTSDGCASSEGASTKIEQAVRRQLEQSGLLQILPRVMTDTAADITQAAKDAADAAAAAAAAAVGADAAAARSSSGGNSSGGVDPQDYLAGIESRAEMLLLCATKLTPWWPVGLPRQQMAGALAGPVCHLSLACVHLVSNLLIGQQQPHLEVALVMQGLLHKALKGAPDVCSSSRGCVSYEMTYQVLCDNPALLGVINSPHFLPSVALNSAVMALAVMIKERQGRQHAQGSTRIGGASR
jgi:hypothetical protein